MFVTIGDPTVIFVSIVAEGKPPSHTPDTSCTASTLAVVTPTLSTRLKLSTAWPATGYLIISPTLRLDMIFAFGLVITPVLVAICTWSATPKPFNWVFWRTISPMKSTSISLLSVLESWYTDFTSRILWISTLLIDLINDWSPFIMICSPVINVPDVWTSLTAVVLLTFDSTNPVAPLLTPLTKDPAGHCNGLNNTFTSKSVNVCTSNK